MFSRIDSIHLASIDHSAVERALRQMHFRTGSNQWAERASIVREQADSWTSRVGRRTLQQAASGPDI